MGDNTTKDDGNNPNFGTGNDGSVTSKYHGSGSPDDFGSWDWKQIEAAITGIAAAHSGDAQGFQDALGVSNPQSLYDAANTFEYIKQTLQMVHDSIDKQTDALANGDHAPWKGPASQSFRQMMNTLSQNVKANAQVLIGDVGADDIPNQVNHNGLQLATAIKTIHDIDIWYANEAVKQGAHVVNGLVMVHEKPKIVEMMTHDMRQVITNLSGHYTVTNDGFTPPNTTDPNGPNNNSGGGNNNYSYGNDNNSGGNDNNSGGNDNNSGGGNNKSGGDNYPFGNNNFTAGGDNNPYGGGNPFGDNGSGGSGNANMPPPSAFPNDLALGGNGGPGSGATDLNPPPVSPFPGGGDNGTNGNGLNGLGGPGGSDLNSFGGHGAVNLADGGPNNFAPPPVSPFPGSNMPSADSPSGNGSSGFVPPPIAPFRGNDSGSSPDGVNSLGGSGNVLGAANPFNDTSGLNTSRLGGATGLNDLAPPVKAFPGGTGGGADGLGGLSTDNAINSHLGGKLETSAPPPVQGVPGLQDGGPVSNGGLGTNQPTPGMPMMPPGMGGMGGGNLNKGDEKSDTSGLLTPTPFPNDLSLGGPGPSGVLDSTDGTAGGFGGLTGLDGFDDKPAELTPTAGFPGRTDVVDPSLSARDNGLGELRQVPAGAGQPVPGMPMMPSGMGAGNQFTVDEKSDTSGLLTPELFPGGDAVDLPPDGILDTGGGPGGSLLGLDTAPAQQPVAMPVLPSTGVTPPPHPNHIDQRSDASGLLTPEHEPWTDNSAATPPQPAPRPDRIAVVRDPDGVEDFGAWDVTDSTSGGLPWMFARDHGPDPTTDIPSPAEQQLNTWRPEKGLPGTQIPAGMPEVRSSFVAPEPAPEPEPDVGAIDAEEPTERTFADLLDRRSDQWETRGSGLPGVLG